MLGNTGILKTIAGKIIPNDFFVHGDDFTMCDKLQDDLSKFQLKFMNRMELITP